MNWFFVDTATNTLALIHIFILGRNNDNIDTFIETSIELVCPDCFDNLWYEIYDSYDLKKFDKVVWLNLHQVTPKKKNVYSKISVVRWTFVSITLWRSFITNQTANVRRHLKYNEQILVRIKTDQQKRRHTFVKMRKPRLAWPHNARLLTP